MSSFSLSSILKSANELLDKADDSAGSAATAIQKGGLKGLKDLAKTQDKEAPLQGTEGDLEKDEIKHHQEGDLEGADGFSGQEQTATSQLASGVEDGQGESGSDDEELPPLEEQPDPTIMESESVSTAVDSTQPENVEKSQSSQGKTKDSGVFESGPSDASVRAASDKSSPRQNVQQPQPSQQPQQKEQTIMNGMSMLFGAGTQNLEQQNQLLESRIRELDDENTGLKNVWNETRSQLSKAKKLLVQKDNDLKQARRDIDDEVQRIVEERAQAHQKEAQKLKQQIQQNAEEFGIALQAKTSLMEKLRAEIDGMKDRMNSKDSDSSLLQQPQWHLQRSERLAEVEAERDDIIRQQAIISEAHSNRIKSLREEYVKREHALTQEKKLHSSTREKFHSRESSLEADNIEYTAALVAAQRELEDKSSQYQRLLGEKQWLEADHQALKEELTAAKSALEVERDQALKLQKTARDHDHQIHEIKQEHEQNLVALQKKLVDRQQHVQDLEARIAAAEADPKSIIVANLQKRNRTMADHLLQKQNQIEQLNSEKTNLQVQLENEMKHMSSLESQLQEARSLDDDSDIDIEAQTDLYSLRSRDLSYGLSSSSSQSRLGGGVRRRRRGVRGLSTSQFSSPVVKKALKYLDSAGQEFGVLLRRKPFVRLGFIIYVIVLHLWVMFVLHHFMYHDHSPPVAQINDVV